MGARLEISGRMVRVKCRQQGLGELFAMGQDGGDAVLDVRVVNRATAMARLDG
jgi:hypothetical protein